MNTLARLTAGAVGFVAFVAVGVAAWVGLEWLTEALLDLMP